MLVTNRRAAEPCACRPDQRLAERPNASAPAFAFLPRRRRSAAELPIQRAVRGEAVGDEVLELRFDNGDSRVVLIRAAVLRDAAGDILGAVAAAADVTERHRYEDRLKLLLDELNHRVKNTLATVQSIALQTLRNARDTDRRGSTRPSRPIDGRRSRTASRSRGPTSCCLPGMPWRSRWRCTSFAPTR